MQQKKAARNEGINMVKILDRIFEWHDEIDPDEIKTAWNARLKTEVRMNEYQAYITALGISSTGRFIKMIAFDDDGDTIIFHAMTPLGNELFSQKEPSRGAAHAVC